MTTGWICLHRGLLDWEWYSDINTTRLFIHCMLRANHKPKKWRGINIERGQFWTSVATLTKETGLSASKIKTAFSKLEMTGELASKGQAGGRMITVLKYDSYQDNSQQVSQSLASQSPASSQPLATNNNDNNENHENNENNKRPKPTIKMDLDWGDVQLTEQQKDDIKGLRLAAKAKLTQRALNTIIKELDKAAMAGIGYEESIDIWALRNWKGFNAQWAIDHKGTGQQNNQVLSRQDSKRVTSVNNLINMFEPSEVIENGQPKQLPTNNA